MLAAESDTSTARRASKGASQTLACEAGSVCIDTDHAESGNEIEKASPVA